MSRELPELILSTLSAGPVGTGDALGQIDAANLKRAVRADSVLLKPDVPIEPIDASFVSDARVSSAPMVAATRSGDEVEVFAYPRASSQAQATVSLRQLGIQGPAYAWDWVRHTGNRIPAGGTLAMPFQDGWAYWVVTPLDKDGIAVLGDTKQIVPLSRERFPSVRNSAKARVTVAYARGEEAVTLTGYALSRPILRAVKGSLDAVQYFHGTHLFRVTLHPVADARTAEVLIRHGP